jgi:exodeoxyribonuclease V beta subunit
MAQHHYTLQYHLYSLATDRFLSARLPGYDYHEHFGGVFYLFIRGVDPARPEQGIYRDKPSFELIQELRKLAI